MPELPEVEAARRAIEEYCVGKKIKRSIIADDPKVIDGVSRSEFEASLSGKTIVSVRRKGKHLWLVLDSPPFPTFQFGTDGAIYIKGVAVKKFKRSAVNDTDEWPSKYSKFFIEFDHGLQLSFTDKRRLAKVRLLKDPLSVPPISELGPDSLFEFMTLNEFTTSLNKRRSAIKALLVNQSFISGIGNWIADEVLYQARIHPLQIPANLTKEDCQTLYKTIKKVIEKAIEVGADISQFPTDWIFHSRGKKTRKALIDGKKIDFIKAGGWTTAYVPEVQKLRGSQGAEEAAKASGITAKRICDFKEPANNDDCMSTNVKSKMFMRPNIRDNVTSKKRKSERNCVEDDDDSDDDDLDDMMLLAAMATVAICIIMMLDGLHDSRDVDSLFLVAGHSTLVISNAITMLTCNGDDYDDDDSSNGSSGDDDNNESNGRSVNDDDNGNVRNGDDYNKLLGLIRTAVKQIRTIVIKRSTTGVFLRAMENAAMAIMITTQELIRRLSDNPNCGNIAELQDHNKKTQ